MNNEQREAKLAFQINKRLEILREWDNDGVPEGYPLPKSLNQAREWVDEALEIERIGSPSSFTKNHEEHGRTITKIAKLLPKLNAPEKKRYAKPDPAKQLKKLKNASELWQEALVKAANQHVEMSLRLEKTQRLYRVAQQSQEEAQNELADALEKIRELKSKLVVERSKSGRAKVASIDFGSKK